MFEGPLRTKSKLADPSNWHWVQCIHVRQMAPPFRVAVAVRVAECEYFEGDTPIRCLRALASLKLGSRNLDRWNLRNLRLMLKISYADCPGLSLVILA